MPGVQALRHPARQGRGVPVSLGRGEVPQPLPGRLAQGVEFGRWLLLFIFELHHLGVECGEGSVLARSGPAAERALDAGRCRATHCDRPQRVGLCAVRGALKRHEYHEHSDRKSVSDQKYRGQRGHITTPQKNGAVGDSKAARDPRRMRCGGVWGEPRADARTTMPHFLESLLMRGMPATIQCTSIVDLRELTALTPSSFQSENEAARSRRAVDARSAQVEG